MVTRDRFLVVAVVALVVLSGCSALGNPLSDSPDEPHSLTFENATAESGLDYRGNANGAGAGNNAVHAGDVDNDGRNDLLVLGGERPALFLNEGGEFARSSSFPDVDADLKSATFVDYDGDGWDDILLFPPGDEPIALRNDAGTYERTDLGLGELTYPLGATAADYDADGDRDLFVYQSGSWSERNPAGYNSIYRSVDDDNGNSNVLFENTADGFERVDGAGIEGDRWSLAASFVDLTGDGRPDVHVANDFNNDTVYLNRGDGTFEQRLLGGSTARNGMSSEVADVNGDGLLDVFVTNIEIPLEENEDEMSQERYDRIERLFSFVIKSGRTKGNTLLVNRGDGEFVDRADEYGVRTGGWGWAASLTDFNNDGVGDLIQATEHVVRVDPDDPTWTYPMVWRGQPDNTTYDRMHKSDHGIGSHNSRGMTTLDYDDDGDRDVVFAVYGGPLVLYENTAEEGSAVQFEVVDGAGATALGATVTVEADGDETVVRQTDENDFFSQESRTKHVGVDDAESVTLRVTWPDGTERTFDDVAADQRLRLSPDGLSVVANLTSQNGD